MTALIVFAHGSSVESANDAVRDVAAELARQGGYQIVEAAFLGGGSPDLRGAVDRAVSQGARRVVVLPYFLTLGLHLQRDLPDLVEQARAGRPDVQIDVAPPLDGHPALVQILLDRAGAAVGDKR